MNKTVNINLGGIFFHIDEDAYQKLSRYFDAIKRSLSKSSGQDEIIKDIEMRIAELVAEKHTHDKQVISLKEIDEIITVMGQPEDYRIDEDDQPAAAAPAYEYLGKRTKKLYRDTEKGLLGGVCTGLGHYFGIDAVWLRILFVILLLGFGVGIIPYLVLWIVMPSAKTTAEKLEMTGEPVTISNIERKVREEAQNLAERYGRGNSDRLGNDVKTGFERAAGGVGDAFSSVFKVFAKILGALIVVFSAFTLIGMLIALFTLGSTSLVDVPWQPYVDSVNYSGTPLWLLGVMMFLAIGVPFFFLFLLGLKLINNNVRSIGSIAKYTLIALWAISVAGLIVVGVKQATEIAYDNKEVIKENIALKPGDTLTVKFRYNDYFSKDIHYRHDYHFTQDADNKEVIYSNRVRLHVQHTDELVPYLQIEKKAKGRNSSEARERAKDIRYTFAIAGNQVVLDNYLLMPKDSKYRDQEVEIFLYLPKGVLFKPDSNIRDYDHSDDWFFNLHHSGNYLYEVKQDKIFCLDCPIEENDYEDLEYANPPIDENVDVDIDMGEEEIIEGDTMTRTVTVNGKIVSETVSPAPNKGLEVGPDGTIIKKK